MTQFYNLTKFLAAAMFKKPSPIIPEGAIPPMSEPGIVLTRVRQLTEERKFNTAENLLFDSFNKEKPVFAAIALEFYARLSELDESVLTENDFSVEEIGEGLRDMMNFYNVKIAVKKGPPPPGAVPVGKIPVAPGAMANPPSKGPVPVNVLSDKPKGAK